MVEMVEYVDDYDRVIGITTRAEANQKGYNVRIAAVLIFNSKNEIVLQRVSHLKKKDALKWSYSAAGHVDPGEEYPQAALRELKEEMGVEGEIESHIGLSRTVDPMTKKQKSFHRVYKVKHDGPFTYDPNEVESIQAFPIDQLVKMVRENPNQFKQNLLDIFKILGIQ